MNPDEIIKLLEIIKICSDYESQRNHLFISEWPNHWTVQIDGAIKKLKEVNKTK